ncbi:MBL fold metallo-hydrolase RNA specificity domain-containing protein [Moritella sp. Urea-trap-13]|uniref:MBL fold metallo-hydrolase RNA specificity domain-containing protein n=1 Tax=Moritella sp. Urea-trap-13 TaxID=2058327 RepID=UPI000C33ADC9|nr:MBL fold metallo-hydrolase [Moritella sp. Urea-trap-13]PKH09299.1 MBL fold metallo-hydrolase [Moritella sp. Urea-trap-13]
MNITFLGGTETVTGSKYFVESGNTKILVDCGLYQGYKWLRERNREPLPLDIQSLDAIVLTHAHLDHSGFIPALYKQGYRGPIYTHAATISLCSILLPDSGKIQEEDARYFNKYKISKHGKPEPLYDKATAEASLVLFKAVPFDQAFTIGNITVTLQTAGHILGAASVILQVEGKRIGFSGDVGQPNDVIMYPPKPLPDLDLLMLESTYGNRLHGDDDPYEQLAQVVNATAKKGGTLLIPSFAVGRTEAIQHMLATLIAEERIPKLPIYLDSPMAISVFDIYCEFDELHRLNRSQCRDMTNLVKFTRDVDESKLLHDIVMPHIIIAGSGMATGGRIIHHMKRLIGDHRTTVLFIGYVSGGTRGAKMLAGCERVKIHGEWLPIKADIEVLDGLSGHGDYVDLTNWLQASKLTKNTRIQLVHGDPDASEAMRDHLRQHTKFDVEVASYHKILRL